MALCEGRKGGRWRFCTKEGLILEFVSCFWCFVLGGLVLRRLIN